MQKPNKNQCPWNCGICPEHQSQTLIGIVVVTNRCNLKCPVCLAKAGDISKIYEPTFEEIKKMLQAFKSKNFAPPTIAFSGGEPTLRDDIPALIKMANAEGFERTEVITNGLRLAEDFEYVKALKDANLSQLGLQFDSLEEETYLKLRGRPLLKTKLKALENLRKVKQPTILAVTLVEGINTNQIGAIINFAIENKEIVEHINFQLISFAGKAFRFNIKNNERMDIDSFLEEVEKQTVGKIKKSDFYNPDYIAPIPEFIEAFTGVPQVKFFPHPKCNIATYLLVDKKKKHYTPLNRLFDLPRFLKIFKNGINELSGTKGIKRFLKKGLILTRLLNAVFSKLRIPIFRNLFIRALGKKSYDPLADLKDTLMISCANYMSGFDFTAERAKRCVIHYIFKDGKTIPFCNYNVLHLTEKQKEFGSY